jgi:hypothetical protein
VQGINKILHGKNLHGNVEKWMPLFCSKKFSFYFKKFIPSGIPQTNHLLLKDGHGSHVKNDRLSKRLWI